jgi:hypothetical protein
MINGLELYNVLPLAVSGGLLTINLIKMKEFIKKWSNWWILNPKRKQLDDAFEKELNELIEREVALRLQRRNLRSIND